MRTPEQMIEGRNDTRTSQNEQRSQPTIFSELYVSVKSVANHDRAFGVKINPTIDHTHTKKGINQDLPNDAPKPA
jgi:hypothetical protein